MLLFSTLLSVSDNLTKDDFIRLVIEWNQSSRHKENIIPGIVWNGERNIRYGDENLFLDIEEYKNGNIVAVRFEKKEIDGTVWDTDYILNFDEMKLSVRLDRSYEVSLSLDASYSSPYFLKTLADKGYLEDDKGLPVTYEPVLVGSKDIDMLADIINGKSGYRLPVIYVSTTFYGQEPLDVSSLAYKVKGVAHVLVQEGGWINSDLREKCNSKNEYYGSVGIYYPQNALPHKRYQYRDYEASRQYVLDNAVSSVIDFSNLQKTDPLYTWEGVQNQIMSDMLQHQIDKRRQAETARDEADRLIDSVDDELTKLQEKVKELTKNNTALMNENQGLRQKLAGADRLPLLYYGDENDFYPGEIREIVLDILNDALKSLPEKTRRKDILTDIINENIFDNQPVKRSEEIKRLLKGYTILTPSIKKGLENLGFSITDEGKHFKLVYYGDNRYMTTAAKTPSDNRTGSNLAAGIIRDML